MKERSTFLLPRLLPREHVVDRILQTIMGLPVAKGWRVTVEEAKKPRSNEQNNALWGVAYEAIRKATGNDPQDLHDYFCGERYGWVEHTMFGKRKRKPRRTTTTDENGNRSVLSTAEFMDFYAFIQQRMAEFDVQVPDPDPAWREKEQAA